MPSKGSPRVTLRIPADAVDLIDEEIERRNRRQSHDRPWTRTDWFLAAVAEKLGKAERGRGEKVKVEIPAADAGFAREVRID